MIAEKRIIDGIPELFLDGRMVGRTLGRLAEPGYNGPEKLDQYRESDIGIFLTSLHESSNWCWDGRHYDYETYESHFAAILDVRPDIKLIPFVGSRYGVPYFWSKEHPEEMVLQENGNRPKMASFGSELWFRDSTEAIRRFVEHFENSRFADNIAGYNPIYINSEWACKADVGSYGDFSAPMLACFRQYLRRRYAGDERALRAAWKDANVTFETAAIPTSRERLAAGDGPGNVYQTVETIGLKVADYYRCYNERVAELAISFCRACKVQTGGRKLTGMMHLYNYCAPDHAASGAVLGHSATDKLLHSEFIDYFHSPYEYLNRCFGGVHYSQQAHDSVTAAGKLHLDQIDTKTYVHSAPNTNAQSPWETEQILKRDIANSITRNSHHYYYEMSVGCFRGYENPTDWRELTYNRADIRSTISRLTNLSRKAQAKRSAHAAEIALVTSLEGHYARDHRQGFSELYNNGFRQHVLPYIGTPFADYNQGTFADITRRHKLYMFSAAHHVSSEERALIQAKLRADGAVALWFYGSGYVDEKGASLANIEALTGFRLARHGGFHGHLTLDVTDFTHPITQGLEGLTFPACTQAPGAGCTFGSDLDPVWFRDRQEWGGYCYDREQYKFSPAFTVDDPAARPLARLRGLDLPGLAVKQMDGWTSVYCCAPFPPWKLISNLARFAGAHLYSDTQDLIYANADYVAFQANGAGRKTLRLPAAKRLRDAYRDRPLANGVTEHAFKARHGQVEIFELL